MAVRKATAVWQGTLREGSGTMNFDAYEGPYTYASRFEEGEGTNPEELIGAAHAGCYSMFLSTVLTRNGFKPTRIATTATVHVEQVEGAPWITTIELKTEAEVPEIYHAAFMQYAEESKKGCPVSKALAAVNIKLNATLLS